MCITLKSNHVFCWRENLLEGLNRGFKTSNRKSFHITHAEQSTYLQILFKTTLEKNKPQPPELLEPRQILIDS